ncbi:MAG: alkaline phosphatase family protein [Candidatus Marsarchaeota archaeon]|nr:alkaline phosphatase family protein [Candidatus Marsarchaeota archaeon]
MRATPLFVGTIILLAALAPVVLAAPTNTPIDHVVIIMMENHSFDNIFGVYPTMNISSPSSLESSIEKPINLLTMSQPPKLKAVPNGTYWTADPTEGYSAYHTDWNKGKMNNFVQGSGTQSMTYFTASQLAGEWDLAEEYGIGDMYFSSYLSETAPNRLMSLAGYTPVDNDVGPPPYIPVNQSIFGELSHFGVSWGYFVKSPSTSAYPLNYFSGMGKYSSHIGSWNAFLSDLQNGQLPSVSWVMPVGGGASGYSQHPSDNVTFGELWMMNLVNKVEESPFWKSTAVFITYDEGGGYYDQVPPPVVDGVQLGFRVPLIVISPYAKEDYVSNTVLNHASLLAFIDYNWHLPALNTFVADSNIPMDFFDFNQTYQGGQVTRAPLVLGPSSTFPAQPQIPFGELPYARTGSSSVNLAKLGYPIYTPKDSAYTPVYETPPVFAVVAILLIVLLYLVSRIGKRRR